MNFFITFSSDSKITVGIALSATLASMGFLAIMNLTFNPLSLIISDPKSSASLLAHVIEVLF
jgi:hypothetical protein